MDFKFTSKLFFLFCFLCAGVNSFAQNYEYDDLYFSSKDAQSVENKKEQKATTPTSTKQSSVQDPYSITEQRYREHPSYEENETYDIGNNSRYVTTYDDDDYYYSSNNNRNSCG